MEYFFLSGNPMLWDTPITYIILAITVYFSYKGIEHPYEKEKFIFNPFYIHKNKDYLRFFSYGLIHADWIHLIFNMYVLYAFGTVIEMYFSSIFGIFGGVIYLGLYISGLFMSSVYSYFKHLDNPGYNALGASGAVSSIVFAFILISPTAQMGLIFLPGIYFPAVVFGLAYLFYSAYMSKKNIDNIGHDAHYWGSVWGFLYPCFFEPKLIILFMDQLF